MDYQYTRDAEAEGCFDNERPIRTDAPSPPQLRRISLNHLDSGRRLELAWEILCQEVNRPFKLTEEPFFRAGLIRLSETDHIFLMSFHHICCDEWSLNRLMSQFVTTYGSLISASQFKPHSFGTDGSEREYRGVPQFE